MRRLFCFLERLPKYQVGILSLLLVLFFGVLDYVTGPDLSIFIFYLVPVFLASWFLGRHAGAALSLLSAVAWSLADLLSARAYSYAIIPYWNLAMELAFLLVVVYILSALKTSLEHEKLLARTDFLTGAANIRYFSELANVEISRAHRYRRPFSMAYLDIDNFKLMNDQFGHHAGDRLLALAVRTIQETIRITDIVARIGGDEFVLLFPETGFETGQAALRKIQARLIEAVRNHDWPVTFSFGLVIFLESPESVDQMLSIADKTMYEAKRNGKNRMHAEIYAGGKNARAAMQKPEQNG